MRKNSKKPCDSSIWRGESRVRERHARLGVGVHPVVLLTHSNVIIRLKLTVMPPQSSTNFAISQCRRRCYALEHDERALVEHKETMFSGDELSHKSRLGDIIPSVKAKKVYE